MRHELASRQEIPNRIGIIFPHGLAFPRVGRAVFRVQLDLVHILHVRLNGVHEGALLPVSDVADGVARHELLIDYVGGKPCLRSG